MAKLRPTKTFKPKPPAGLPDRETLLAFLRDAVTYYGRLGVRVLRNERVTLGEGDGVFDVARVVDETFVLKILDRGGRGTRFIAGARQPALPRGRGLSGTGSPVPARRL